MPNTFVAISTITVGSGGAANIEFTSIPSTYTDLCLITSLRTTATAYTVADVYLNINNSTNKMSTKIVYGNGTAVGSTGYSNQTAPWTLSACSNIATTNTFSNNQAYFTNYANTSSNKTIILDSITETNAATLVIDGFVAGLYSETNAITSIKLTCDDNFMQYSTATLYGVKKK